MVRRRRRRSGPEILELVGAEAVAVCAGVEAAVADADEVVLGRRVATGAAAPLAGRARLRRHDVLRHGRPCLSVLQHYAVLPRASVRLRPRPRRLYRRVAAAPQPLLFI